jgi:hypothetical protein
MPDLKVEAPSRKRKRTTRPCAPASRIGCSFCEGDGADTDEDATPVCTACVEGMGRSPVQPPLVARGPRRKSAPVGNDSGGRVKGSYIVVGGLTERTELNEQRGKILWWEEALSRYMVSVGGHELFIKPGKLRDGRMESPPKPFSPRADAAAQVPTADAGQSGAAAAPQVPTADAALVVVRGELL